VTSEKQPTRHSSLATRHFLGFRLGLAEAGDFVAGLALTALFEERRAFKTLENIALATEFGHRAQTGML